MSIRGSLRVGTILRGKSAPRGYCRLSQHSGGVVVFGGIIRCSLGRRYGVWSKFGAGFRIRDSAEG